MRRGEFQVGAGLLDPALVRDRDAVVRGRGGQPVGDEDQRLVPAVRAERLRDVVGVERDPGPGRPVQSLSTSRFPITVLATSRPRSVKSPLPG